MDTFTASRFDAMVLRGAACTDVGKHREQNEDAYGVFPDLGLYVVADGIGGHAGGQMASSLSVDEIHRALAARQHDDLTPVLDQHGNCSVSGRRLVLALHDANDRIHAAGAGDPTVKGMGAAVAAVAFDPTAGLAAVCHVGDARVYRVRGQTIEQLTEDHTVVQRLLKAGRIAPEDVESTPHRHMLTRALGIEPLVQPDLHLERAEVGDVFVLSSDGIHDVVGAQEIAEIIRAVAGNLDEACARLVALANDRGGKDNSTVVIVECVGRAGGDAVEKEGTPEHDVAG